MATSKRVPVDRVAARPPMPAYTPLDYGDPSISGFLYVMAHPSWPGKVKLGHCRDPKRRLSAANVHCPEGDFEIVFLARFDNRLAAETETHRLLGASYRRLYGEWFECSHVAAIEAITQVEKMYRRQGDDDAGS